MSTLATPELVTELGRELHELQARIERANAALNHTPMTWVARQALGRQVRIMQELANQLEHRLNIARNEVDLAAACG